jgi:hypothetical protein
VNVRLRVHPWRGGVVHEVYCDQHGAVAAYVERGRAEDRALAHAIGLKEDITDEEDMR